MELGVSEHSKSNILVTIEMIANLFVAFANITSLEKFKVELTTFKEDKT